MPPPPEVAPLAFDGPSASAGIGRTALGRRLAPLLRPARPDDNAPAGELAFRHAHQSCGSLELHALVLAPCRLALDSGEHACLVVPLAGEGRLRPQKDRSPCLVAAADQGAALMPPGVFELRCHDWFSTVLIPLTPERLLNTCGVLARSRPGEAGGPPPGRLDGTKQHQRNGLLERARPWSGNDALQRDLLGLLRQTLRLVESSLRNARADFPPPGWHGDALILQAVALLLLEANGGERGIGADGRERRLDALITHIQANLQRPLSLADLCARSGWSSRSLQYAFQERFGCGPMQWVRRQRLEAARQALERAEPGDQVHNIARRYGYTNLSSFSRDILGTFGSSPSTLRRGGALQRQ